MRREPDFFGDKELELIYIAKKLRKAKALEELLTSHDLDYLVEPDTYTGGVIFRSSRIGAFFYVAAGDTQRARILLAGNRYRPYDPEQ